MKSMTQVIDTISAGSEVTGATSAYQKSNRLLPGWPGSGLELHFDEASLETVLNYLGEAAGLIIHVSPNVPLESTVDLRCDCGVSLAGALALLRKVLMEKGCTLIHKGPQLRIITSQDVKKHYIPLPEF